MHNYGKRLLSLLLVVLMVVSMMPVSALAADEAAAAETEVVAETVPEPAEDPAEEEAPAAEEIALPEPEPAEPAEAPVEEETEVTETPAEEAPVEETPAEETSAEEPVVTETPAEEPVAEETSVEEPVVTEAAPVELSGQTRDLYFYNAEGWDEVYAAWSFDEENFADVEHPGEEMTYDEDMDVWTIEIPVEADEILFNDGVTYTDEELAEIEKTTGEAPVVEIAAELAADTYYDFYVGEDEWINYAAWAEALTIAEEEIVEEAVIEEEAVVLDGDSYTHDVLDGKITETALCAVFGDTECDGNYYVSTDGTSWKQLKYSVGTSIGGYNIGADPNDTLEYSDGATLQIATKGRESSYPWSEYYTVAHYVTIKVYHNVTATLAADSDANATGGSVTATGKVYHNEKATITVTDVDGYKAELYNGTTLVTTLSDTAGWTYTIDKATASVAYTVKYVSEAATEYGVSVKVVNGEWGTATLGKTTGIANDEIALTITPKATDNAVYTSSVAVTNGSYDASTGKVTVDGTGDVVVTVTFSKDELEVNENPTLEINGYHTSTDYSARFTDIKKNILNAVLKNGYTNINDYNLHIWLDNPIGTEVGGVTIGSDPGYFDYDDTETSLTDWTCDYDLLTGANASRFPCADFGDTVFSCILKVKIIDNQGRTVEAEIAVTEAREPATVSFSSAVSGKYDTLDLFKEAVANTINVLDNNNADCKADAGLTVTLNPVEGKANTYTVSYSLANDGATWLATSGTLEGEVVWNITQYTVTFVNEDGTELSAVEYDYGTAADKIVAPTATKADKVDEDGNVMATYTFAGWDPEVSAVTGDATYTATYTEVAKTYTVTFKDYDGSILKEESVEYGSAATAPTATQEYKTETLVYTFKGWDKAFDNITGDLEVTAQYDSKTRYYTVTFKDYDDTKLGTSTVEYGQEATAPADPKRDADETYTYTFAGWDKAFNNITADGVVVTATYTPTYIDYTITWMADGKEYQKDTYHYNDTLVVPTTNPTKADDDNYTYSFKGWDYDNTNDVEVGETAPATVTADATYNAIFSTTTLWDVKVVYGNGTADATGKVEDGSTYTIPAVPTWDGYRFDGWYVGETKVEAGDEYTVTADTTIEAMWIELFTITWMNDGEIYKTETDQYAAGETPTAPADPTKEADAQYTYTFTGWDPKVSAITGDTTYTAIYSKTVNSYVITFTDENGNTLDTQTLDYGVVPVYAGETPAKEYYSYSWSPAIASVTGTATYELVWTPNNDANNNGIADELETAEIEVKVTGNGTVTLAAAEGATLTANDDGTYTLLFNSLNDNTKVVTVTATPNDTTATDGSVDYVITNPGTVTVADGANTITVQFGTHTLNASNGEFTMNGYYESHANMDEIIKTLKADVLNAAGLDGANASNYTVTMKYSLGTLDLDKLSGWANALNATAFFTAIELPETARQFIITDNSTGVSKTVSMKITDSRPSAGLKDTEIADVKVLNDQQGLTDYVNSLLTNENLNPNELTVTVSEAPVEGSWPPASAGVTTKLVYTVSYADDASYIGDSAKLTVYVQSAYNNCTVVADSTLTDGGSLTVSPSNDNTTVAGNDTVTITVTPSGNNVVETITVTKNDTDTVEISAITYFNKAATVTFKSDGSTKADEYVVSATYSQNYLNLKADQTIVYCYDNKNITVDLQKMVFDAIFGGSSAPMTKDNVKLEYAYGEVLGKELWVDVSKDASFSLGDMTHNFGEDGSETIKLTYNHNKYGSFEQTVVLNVFDSCFNNTVKVETVTNGANATIKTQYSEKARTYLGVDYFKQDTALTVTLTPDGAFLDTLKQMYNGTYADSMAYIKSVTVYDKAGNVVDATLTRDQGKLSIDNILDGVNPALYNAAVTFTMSHDEAYKIVAEYGILKLEKKNDGFQMEMYKGGEDYAAEVPSAQELINAILGEAEAAAFLATYGGAYTVEFSTDLINYNWTAVSDEALLALNDGTKVAVRITWKPADNDKTYYPVAVTANVTLVDLRTPTSVAGEVPTEKIEYVDETKLIANLKNAMGLGILADGTALDADYTVTYTITGDDENGYFATVTVTYDGSAEYKPTSKTFENVPVADIPDNATIKVTIQNASDVITNNDGKIQSLDPATGIYTVIGNGTYTFKFTPVSGKAIESVTVNGEPVELTYAKQVATFSMELTEKEHYEVVVETVDSAFVLEDERVYDFAYGVMDPVNVDIVDAAISAPDADSIDYSNVKIEYLARTEGTVTVELPDVDLGFTVIELGTFDIELGELWLDPSAEVTEYDMDKLLDELVTEVIDKVSHGQLAATDAVSYMTEKLQGLTIGAHAFGSAGDGSIETIRMSYEDDKYLLAEVETDITIHDYRTATELVAADCEVTFGYSTYDLLVASGATVMANDEAVSGLAITTNDLYLHANTEAQQVTLKFAGDVNYQPCEVTINVIVNKAACEIDYDSQIITYGDEYDLALSVSPTIMPDGTYAQIDRVEFMIGLDMHTLLDVDIEDKTVGIDEAIGYIQLRLPESIRELPLVGQYLQGEFTLGEFTDLINSLSDVLGIDEGSMETLNQVVEAITGITDNMEIKIIVKDEDFHPTNIGVYIAGAVTVDADFETAYTADYLIIAPKTIEAELAWDYEDENGIMTLPVYQEIFADLMGAHVVESETMTGDVLDTANSHVKYLILGINDETSEFLTTDIYGNIKANIWTSNDAITDNGAYVQIAYMLNWGNEIYYAMPIVRSFVIVPQTAEVQLVGSTGEANNDLLKVFNNEPQGFSVKITDMAGELIYSDHYQDAVNNLSEYAELTVTYMGVQTNGKTYNSTEKPVHAGAYTAIATYVDYDENGNLLCFGMDTGILVIEPAQSSVVVDDKIVTVQEGVSYALNEMVHAQSAADSLIPDTTIITAQISSTGEFSENGWDAIQGIVNVDFPTWMDELIAEYAPSVVDGITVAELQDKLVSKLPTYAAELEELGATAEVINSMTNLVNNVADTLAKLPADAVLSFQDNATASNVGAYLIFGVVTDSDHYPSADAGILVITPDVENVYLKWNNEDANNLWTPANPLDLYASAYNDEEYTSKNEAATEKITYQFITMDEEGNLVILNSADELGNGIYIEIAYIQLELDGHMYISDMIARPVIIVPNVADVIFVDETGAENNDRIFTFDNEGKTMDVQITIAGEVVTPDADNVVYRYTGVQTNTNAYNSTIAPVHAGAYIVTATYTNYDDNGELLAFGTAVGAMVIAPTESDIAVTGKTVAYDGNAHKATIEASSLTSEVTPDTTIITGMVDVDGNIDEVGLDAITANANVDFPKWLDEILAETEAFNEGVTPAYLVDFLSSYIDDVVALIPVDKLVALGVAQEEIDAYIAEAMSIYEETINVLEKMPQDISLTFQDDITFTEPGAYVYYGIVTDSDHLPSADTGLLVITKAPMEFDLLDTTVPYDGEEQFVDVINPENADYFTMIADRDDYTVNFIIEEDMMYLLERLEKYLDAEIPDTIDIAELRANYDVEEIVAAIDEVIAELETLELPDYATKIMSAVKEELSSLPNAGTITINGSLPVDAGEYEVYAISYSEYYETQVSEAILTIAPIYVVIDDVADEKYYGDPDPELTAEVTYYSYSGTEKVEITELPDDIALTYDVVRAEGEDAGKYAMSVENASIIDSKNYVLEVVEDDTVFTIKPAEITLMPTSASKVYGTKDPVFSYTYSVIRGEVDVVNTLKINVTREAGEDVGKYAMSASYTKSDNYIVYLYNDSIFQITPKAITVTADNKTAVYGEEIPELTYTADGLVGNDALTVNLSTEATQGSAAGEYGIYVDVTPNSNYTITEVDGILTIEKAEVTVTIHNVTKYYGDKDVYDETVTGWMEDGSMMVVNYDREEGEDIGEYDITATAYVFMNDNYKVTVVNEGATLTILPAVIDVNVNNASKTYGEDDPTPEYSVNTIYGTVENANITIDRVAGENIGTYEYTAESNSENYTINAVTGALTINAKAITEVTLVDTLTYTGKEQTQTITVKSGDTVLVEGTDYTVTQNKGTDAGTYTLTVESIGNYAGTIDQEWTIAKAVIEVTIADVTKYYGEDDSFESSHKTDFADEFMLVVEFEREIGENVGKYAITASGYVFYNEENFDVQITNNSEAKLTILPAEITVKADNKEMVVGTEVPDLTVTSTVTNGKLTEEELAALKLTATTEATSESKPGEYAIVPSYEANDNYTVTVENGTLTITLGDYVCWDTNGTYYDDVTKALNTEFGRLMTGNGTGIVQMLKDYAETDLTDPLIIYPGMTLDLNGFDLTASLVAGCFEGANIIDTTEHAGRLIADPVNVALDENNDMFPVYDGTGYLFADVLFNQNYYEIEGGVYFYHIPAPVMDVVSLLKDGAADNELRIVVRMTWEAKDGTGTAYQDFVYNEDTIMNVYNSNLGAQTYYDRMFYLNFTGIDNMVDLKMTAMIISNTGAYDSGKTLSITY